MVAPFNETPVIKARWELNKDAASCFEQILEVAPDKTIAVQPLISHLTDYPCKKSKTFWTLQKWKQTEKRSYPMDSFTMMAD